LASVRSCLSLSVAHTCCSNEDLQQRTGVISLSSHCSQIKSTTLTNIITWRTDDTFPTFSLKKNFRPPPFEEFLQINFQFYIVSILHSRSHDRR
jgi:hypothetical protein